MKILAIDCSAHAASVAITEDEKILSSSYTNIGLTHSQTLVPMVYNTLTQAQLSLEDINVFAINAGPGSFTGVRIGVAALKGLTEFTEHNCLSISTLESMAYLFSGIRDGIVCAVMDARCSQVYTATFELCEGEVMRLTEDEALPISELGQRLKTYTNPPLLVGDGAVLCYNALKDLVPDLELAPEQLRYQNATGVAACAFAKLSQGEQPISSDQLLPVYLRAPQAERELKKKKAETLTNHS